MFVLIAVSFCLISTTLTWAPDPSEDVFKSKLEGIPPKFSGGFRPTISNIDNPEAKSVSSSGQRKKLLTTFSKKLRPDPELYQQQPPKPDDDRSKVSFNFFDN